MRDGQKSGGWEPGSVKALLLLVAAILVIGALIGAALTAIGPSQDPNTSVGGPGSSPAAAV